MLTYKCIHVILFFHIVEKKEDSFIRQPVFNYPSPFIYVFYIYRFIFEDVRDELILQAFNARATTDVGQKATILESI
ncbi:hypothetical protein EUGRSUZ_H03846 [Eucalyptus grandis]|uniref:Uncharacterized protein n=2 Tax=Eucalyptus grandis TaxID=71139 RepID=A0ACC3JVR2_EUCGR|nr:hypothetical protein EUGRSUZ_H03846 [Eucalyptus grandis]